jgi:hypothetical protein
MMGTVCWSFRRQPWIFINLILEAKFICQDVIMLRYPGSTSIKNAAAGGRRYEVN